MTAAHPDDDDAVGSPTEETRRSPGARDGDELPSDSLSADGLGTDGHAGSDSAADTDAAFAAIVAGIRDQMMWSVEAAELDAGAGSGVGFAETGDERTERRQRRAERAAEHAEYRADQAAAADAGHGDEAHFVPPPPPPLPRLRPRTIGAILLVLLGIALFIWPEMLQVSGSASMVLAVLALTGGFALLILALPHQHSDPAAGGDDGARL